MAAMATVQNPGGTVMSEPSILIRPVILCGGSGTRLWPASRESMPKQFARLVDPELSTFQATARRVDAPGLFARASVIAAAESRFIVADQDAADWLFLATPIAAVGTHVSGFPENSLNVRLPLAGATVSAE